MSDGDMIFALSKGKASFVRADMSAIVATVMPYAVTMQLCESRA
jgi:hypothetical protein